MPEDVSQPVEHRTLAIQVDRRKVHLGGLADAGGQRQRVDLFDQTGQGQRHPFAIKTRQRRQRRTLAGQRFADSVQARIGKPRQTIIGTGERGGRALDVAGQQQALVGQQQQLFDRGQGDLRAAEIDAVLELANGLVIALHAQLQCGGLITDLLGNFDGFALLPRHPFGDLQGLLAIFHQQGARGVELHPGPIASRHPADADQQRQHREENGHAGAAPTARRPGRGRCGGLGCRGRLGIGRHGRGFYGL